LLWIQSKETQQSIDPTKTKCCNRRVNRRSKCCKLSGSTDRHDPHFISSNCQLYMGQQRITHPLSGDTTSYDSPSSPDALKQLVRRCICATRCIYTRDNFPPTLMRHHLTPSTPETQQPVGRSIYVYVHVCCVRERSNLPLPRTNPLICMYHVTHSNV